MSKEYAILKDAPEELQNVVAEYLDDGIQRWRGERDDPDTNLLHKTMATHYVDSLQSTRRALLGEILMPDGESTSPTPGAVLYEPNEEEQAVILRYASLKDAMEDLINEYQAEQGSNTPDFILARFLTAALSAFETAINSRDSWYDISPRPGSLESEEESQA